jgi:peptidyl-prolyl cis-trans isomerase SurA
MAVVYTIRSAIPSKKTRLMWFAICLVLAGINHSEAQQLAHAATPATKDASTVTLDRVVAVVNRQAILASDVEQQVQTSIFDPNNGGHGPVTPQRALQQLISAALIQQQIQPEDAKESEPTPQELAALLKDIRTESPACAGQNCVSDEGWQAFLAAHHLTPERVEAHLRFRTGILRFIEMRFRQGISISPEEIKAYYTDALLPQYPPGQAPPSLEQVAPRIREILLQQQVNVLFQGWLDNLRKQGQIEVLDPALEAPDTPGPDGAGTE